MYAMALGLVVGAGAGGCLHSPTGSEASAASAVSSSRPRGEAGKTTPKDAGARVVETKPSEPLEAIKTEEAPAPPPSPKHYQRVLHVGDSTVGGYGGLARALKKRFTAEETLYSSDTIVSLGIRTLARSKTLKADLAKVNPDLVLLTVGANDVFLPSPDQLATDVRAIVATVGARDCIWIGPPTWKKDTGIVDVIRANVGHCRFFDSSLLPLARAKDGIHPTDRGGEEWAERFWPSLRQVAGGP